MNQHTPNNDQFDDPLKSLIHVVSPYTNLTPEDIEELQELDLDLTVEYLRISEEVDRIRADLNRVSGSIDENSALRRPFNEQDTGAARFTDEEYFKVRPIGRFYAHLMTKPGRERLEQHLTAFEESLVPALREGVDCRFESGGVKSIKSVLDHLFMAEKAEKRLQEIKSLKDAIRGRIVVPNILAAETVMENLHAVSAQDRHRVVSLRNSHRNWEEAFEGRLHFACNVTLAPEDENLPPYELQIMTETAQRIAKVTHPVAVNGHIRGQVRLPPRLERHMMGLAMGSAVKDGREYLSRRV